MPKRTSYQQGTPNWVDLQTTDLPGAKSFYGPLFGWRFDDRPVPTEATGEPAGGQGLVYSMVYRGDDMVAVIAPQPPEMAAQGVPPVWNTYLAVDDIDATVKLVPDAGGTLAMGPFEVTDAGRSALVLDPTGAACYLWQAGRHIGATVVNEPGTLIWNELQTTDVDAAVPFYQRILGLVPEAVELAGVPWVSLKVGADAVAGVVRKPTQSVPDHWHVYFAADDTRETARRVTELGGKVVNGPTDTPIGPMAVIRDPQGALFSIFAPAPPAG